MNAAEFIKLLRQQPFVPLRVHMTDGTSFEVRHPEMVLVTRTYINLGIDPDPATGVLAGQEHYSFLHIVRVEELSVPTTTVNGPGT